MTPMHSAKVETKHSRSNTASSNECRLRVTVTTFSNLAAGSMDTRSLGIRDLVAHLSSKWAINLAGHSCGPQDSLHKHIVRYGPLDMSHYDDIWPNCPGKALRLLKVIRQISNYAAQSDIVYTDIMYGTYARRPGQRVPGLVMEVHGITSEEGQSGGGLRSGSWQLALYKLVERRAFHLADRLIAVSGSIKKYLEHEYHVCPGRIHVIPNGVDPAFLARDASGDKMRERYAWGDAPIDA